MKLKFLLVCMIMTVILLPPLLLRPKAPKAKQSLSGETDKLIIITPHNESVKSEWEKAFQKHYLKKYGKRIEFDYRAPGGTSDIMRYIADRYQAEYRRWRESRNLPWNSAVASGFSLARLPENASAEVRAHRRHLEEIQKGIATQDEAAVKASLLNRDKIDSSRKTAPLKVADGAVVIDSTELTIDEVLAAVLDNLPAEYAG